jgi:AraC family transcriptional regulator
MIRKEQVMDWLSRMNRVLDYIEERLQAEIDYEAIASISCTSGDLFQRMFSNFTEVSLGEYIRRRRLSEAAFDLRDKNSSVTEVALDYGYESSDAFAYAFKKQHGITPSEVKRNDVTLARYPRLSFQIIVKGNEPMKYRIVEKAAFKVVGKSLITTQEKNLSLQVIPNFWAKAHRHGLIEKICPFSLEEAVLGVCYDGKPDGTFSYMIGVVASSTSKDLEILKIPAATWAVFESVGPMPKAIQDVWKKVYQEFLPNSGYEHAMMPDFERYPSGNTADPKYYCEVWIPIVKKA